MSLQLTPNSQAMLKEGDWYSYQTTAPGNQRGRVYKRWNGSEFVSVSRSAVEDGDEIKRTGYTRADNAYTSFEYKNRDAETSPEFDASVAQQVTEATLSRIKALDGPDQNYTDETVLRYPSGQDIGKDTHYVMFQFKRYSPPFKNREKFDIKKPNQKIKDLSAWARGSYDYNQSDSYIAANQTNYPSIIMYMPEDVSTGFRGNWGGKAFSTFGANMLSAAGQSGLDKKLGAGISTLGEQAEKGLGLTAAAALRKSIQKITGDSLSNDDVFGAISGAILNPNTELLFQSVDMRNFMLKFKLVPRSGPEGKIINKIVQTFKACTLPTRDPGKVFGFNKDGQNQGVLSGFIGVPHLCRISFMIGDKEHDVLPRYKVCAVTQVDVNYTPDGAYSTYYDGQPTAMELSINFQETKINFAEEVIRGSIR